MGSDRGLTVGDTTVPAGERWDKFNRFYNYPMYTISYGITTDKDALSYLKNKLGDDKETLKALSTIAKFLKKKALSDEYDPFIL